MKFAAALVGSALIAGTAHAAELYSNGPVVNGINRSILIAPASTYGFGDQSSEGNAVADDFSVAAGGWTLTDIDFFGYQTGAGAFSFTDVTWSILSGDVNTGTVVASGTTGVTNGGLEGYRVTATTLGNTDRAIYRINANIADLSLAAGSYWLRWSLTGSSAFSGPWQPPTSDRATGDAQQSIAGGAFATIVEAGSGLTVELPFALNGTPGVVSTVPEPSTWLSLAAGLLLFTGLRRRKND